MQHGFKAWAEKKSAEVRRELSLKVVAPLPARRVAAHLGITVIGPAQIPGITAEVLEQLLVIDPESWSATTISRDGCTVIIHNTMHLPWRQESDLMHEIAHLLREHEPCEVIRLPGIPFPLRKFAPDHEDEAGWLGGCLQLPRPALLWASRRGMTDESIGEHFGASEQMVRFRRNTTGVSRQLTRMGVGR